MNVACCIITFCALLILQASGAVPDEEQTALLAFYNGLTPASRTALTGFQEGTDVCTWSGVTCSPASGDAVRNVVGLKYDSLNLEGTLSSRISLLSKLEDFNIGTNNFNGQIPDSIFQMTSLKTLRLSENQFSGTLPSSLNSMSSLQKIYLNQNKLTGNLPDKVANLAGTLNYFTAANNNLIGPISGEYGQLTKLTFFLLNVNGLTGPIPASLGNLTSVTQFKISSNQLTGSIPAELGGMRSCTLFHVYSNQLTGSIPDSLGQLLQVQELHLYTNSLTGKIPDSIGLLSNMYSFRASTNKLTGGLPVSIGALSNLVTMDLFSNQLDGTIPTTIGGLQKLQQLTLYGNAMRGFLPLSIVDLVKLQIFRIHNNQFRGPIPDISALPLTQLNLDGNQFDGNFPSFWPTRPNIATLVVTKNCWNTTSLPGWAASGYTQLAACTLNTCGDGTCSALRENCTTCPQDCPSPCEIEVAQNECLMTPNGGCDSLTTCSDTPYSYKCSACPSGYSGNGLAGCSDIDECQAHLDTCDKPFQDCINTIGSYNCTDCKPGSYLVGQLCQDVDECLVNNGGCSQFRPCVNTKYNGSYCGPCPSNRNTIGNDSCSDIIDTGSHGIVFHEYSKTLYGGIGAIVAIGVCIAMFAVVMLAMFWQNFSKHGSFYCAVIVAGAFLSYIAAISVLPEHTDELCLVFPWFLGIAFSLVYGCLFIKTWTLYTVWRNATNFKKTNYTPFFILKLLAINLSFELVFLIIWTIVDPPKVHYVKMVDDSYAPLCESKSNGWWAVFLSLKGAWMVFGAVLSILTRDVVKEYNESGSIAYATYNNVVLAIIGVPLALVLRKVPGGVEIIMVAITTIAFTFTICILFFDIWYHAIFPDKSLMESKLGSRVTSSTTYSGEMRSSNISHSANPHVSSKKSSSSKESKDSQSVESPDSAV